MIVEVRPKPCSVVRLILQTAQVCDSTEIAEARSKYLELELIQLQQVDAIVQTHFKVANEVQAQLVQVPCSAHLLKTPVSDNTEW